MKKIITTILLLSILVVGCESDHPILDSRTPLVLTGKVKTIKDNGAIFSATTHNLGSVIPDLYGFIITDSRSVKTFRVTGSGALNGNEFSLSLETDLEKDISYMVKAFIQIGENTVGGPTVNFVSEGCKLPSLDFQDPITLFDGDIIEIKGSNFSVDTAIIDLSIFNEMGTVPLQIVELASSVIKAKVPDNSVVGPVGLRMNNQVTKIVNENFGTIRAPKVNSVTPTVLKVGMLVNIEGDNLIMDGTSLDINIDERYGYSDMNITYKEETNNKVSFYYPQQARGIFDIKWRGKTILTPELSWESAYTKEREIGKKDIWTTARVGGFTYCIFEEDDEKSLVRFNPNNGLFEKKVVLPIDWRQHYNLFSFKDELYFTAVGRYSWRSEEFWKYNVEDNEWIRLADLPKLSNSDFFIPLNTEGKLIYIVKADLESSSNTFELYEFKADENQWVFIDEKIYPDLMGEFNRMHRCYTVEFDGHTYVYKGEKILLEFDKQSYELKKFIDVVGNGIVNGGAFVANGKLGIVVAGGGYRETLVPYVLDFDTREWISLEGVEGYPGFSHLLFWNGNYYMWARQSYYKKTLWKFNP